MKNHINISEIHNNNDISIEKRGEAEGGSQPSDGQIKNNLNFKLHAAIAWMVEELQEELKCHFNVHNMICFMLLAAILSRIPDILSLKIIINL